MKVTSYLHSDTSIVGRDGGFEFEPGSPSLFVEVLEPKQVKTAIEKNILTAPGRPGSVDKGEREERGVRLSIVAPSGASALRFRTTLTIKN